jgi:hypothetical protein
MRNDKMETFLKYRGSDHGWNAEQFHELCDNIGPSITLIKLEDGSCIGGFTTAKWCSPFYNQTYFKEDKYAKIFNLTY